MNRKNDKELEIILKDRDKAWWGCYAKYSRFLDTSCFEDVIVAKTQQDCIKGEPYMYGKNWLDACYDDESCRYKSVIFGCDWLYKECIEEVRTLYETDLDRWFSEHNPRSFYNDMTKGSVTTAGYLCFTTDPIKRAAVWMTAFIYEIYDLLDYYLDNDQMIYVSSVLRMSSDYISKECEWHHAMKRHVIAHDIDVEKVRIGSVKDVFVLAGQALKYVRENYGLLLYVTMDSNGELMLPEEKEKYKDIIRDYMKE